MAERTDAQPTDPSDNYTPAGFARDIPRLDAAQATAIVDAQVKRDLADLENMGVNLDGYEQTLRDAYANRLTGIGDPNKDKTYGGQGRSGPEFLVQYMSSWEAMDRWRGSDIGANVIERIPNEMTRNGWTINVQPEEGEFEPSDPAQAHDDAGLFKMLRRTLSRLGFSKRDSVVRQVERERKSTARTDAFPAPPSADPPHVPAQLPHLAEDGSAIIEQIQAQQRRLALKDRIREALCFKRAFGGAGILLGVDDGNMPLTTPLDATKIKSINHLTVFRGGWDGEIVAWSYYDDPRHPKYGEPKVYMLRNIGVPVGGGPAPGEPSTVAQRAPATNLPFASTIFWVHESRLLLFAGQPVSRWARVQMRGWSDTVFTRVDRVLSQFDQTWSGISILMAEYSLPVLSMEGLSKLLAEKTDVGMKVVLARAKAQQLAQSIAQLRIIDTKEKLERLTVSLSGTAEVLNQFSLRLAAAAGMPVSMLFGQVQSGLGDASKGDIIFFYDQVAGWQEDEVLPVVERVTRLQFLATETSPTKGKIPQRWSVEMNPLMQPTPKEEADRRKVIADTDKVYIDAGVLTPEEVAAKRFGGADFDDGAPVLDMEGRRALALAAKEAPAPEPEVDPTNPDTGEGDETTPVQPATPASPPPAPAATTDAAEFFSRNGRTRVRTQVSIVVPFNDKGEVLLGRKRESGKLCHPGGHAEQGEDAYSTAYRELWEETGLHPIRMQQIGTRTIGGPLAHLHITIFRALVAGQPDASHDPDKEFDAFVWAPMTSGDYPPDVKAQLHHERDVVGPMLRRRAR